MGDGAGSFGPKTDFATGTAPAWLEIGDVSGDGKLDMAVANYGNNTVSVLLNAYPTVPVELSRFTIE